MKKPMQNFLSIPIAHRGLYNDAVQENSLEAFRLAVEGGFGIEFDVHATSDDHLVVMHDYNTARCCNKSVDVEKSTIDVMNAIRLNDGQKIPTLQEVLTLVSGRVPIVIELKCPLRFDKRLADLVLNALQDYPNQDLVCLESFHPVCVKYLKKRTDRYPIGQLATGLMGGMPKFMARYLGRLKMIRWNHPDFVCYDILSLPNPYVEKVRKGDMPIITYTVNTYEKLQLAKTCTDNFIFEKINVKKEP